MRDDEQKMQQEKILLVIRKKRCESITKYWKRCPDETKKSPPLDIARIQLDMALINPLQL